MPAKPSKVLLIRAEGKKYVTAAETTRNLKVAFSEKGIAVDDCDDGDVYDIAIAIGGDGTMMKAVTSLASRNIPTLGINAGDVGFLTTAEATKWEQVVERICSGNYVLEQRLGLELIANSEVVGPIANEVVLRHPYSVAVYEISIGGQVFYSNLMGDGVMVATATGSTGYNTSANGPILLPSSSNVVVTPLNPMSLTTRPLVAEEVAQGKTISVRLVESKKNQPIMIVADGVLQEKGLQVGDSVSLCKYGHALLFATFGLGQYAKALTEKKGFAK
ncbi:NAD(+)/NADH kinase [Candidatus Nomurabacteria bacterium]|nr:NAD(+)/NADH kinase [Candidatus Kaiserbacteria bacterium]MCB9814623.1 NAD(+)/NADH kinase [Candidatus Nomurabacteria bacterium]